ncbi:MAG TPA: tetratricopeptide repeat protein [Rubricoccaceae bacterium]|nr:tetratricopeptide repeat protein [Rubricoccaceae bacterium]
MTASTADRFAVKDFQREVIEASRMRPVLVDFWAPWCGPCRMLSPVLERLADEEVAGANRWALATVNTDEHPDLAAAFGVRGIPAVKLIADGRVAAEFTGALPEYAVRQWLAEALPSEAKGQLVQAEAALAEGDPASARALLTAVLDAEPEGPAAEAARAHLARLLVFEDPDRAEALAKNLVGPEADAVRALAAALRLDPRALSDAPVREAYAEGLRALHVRDFDTALARFIAVVQRDRAYDDDGARRLAVALFTVLGENDPIVKKHRPAFNMSLY